MQSTCGPNSIRNTLRSDLRNACHVIYSFYLGLLIHLRRSFKVISADNNQAQLNLLGNHSPNPVASFDERKPNRTTSLGMFLTEL